jgi:hypothetical protein
VKKGEEILVGRCDITFHCTPKSMVREREERRKSRHQRLDAKRKELERAAENDRDEPSKGAPDR